MIIFGIEIVHVRGSKTRADLFDEIVLLGHRNRMQSDEYVELFSDLECAKRDRDAFRERSLAGEEECRKLQLKQSPSRSAGSDLERFEQVLDASTSFSNLMYVLCSIKSNTDGMLKSIDRKLIAKPRRVRKQK